MTWDDECVVKAEKVDNFGLGRCLGRLCQFEVADTNKLRTIGVWIVGEKDGSRGGIVGTSRNGLSGRGCGDERLRWVRFVSCRRGRNAIPAVSATVFMRRHTSDR
jgi:hypothetical protein